METDSYVLILAPMDHRCVDSICILYLFRKPEHAEGTLTCTGETCMLHTERPQCKLGTFVLGDDCATVTAKHYTAMCPPYNAHIHIKDLTTHQHD